MKVLMKDGGKITEVTAGYARNYLFPKGLAELATKEVLARQAGQKARLEAEAAKQAEINAKLAAKLDGKSVKFELKTTETGKLHGSVTAAKIARRLKVGKESVKLGGPIRKVGRQQVQLKFGQSQAKVWVVVRAI